jgi:hypothetical protein
MLAIIAPLNQMLQLGAGCPGQGAYHAGRLIWVHEKLSGGWLFAVGV